MKVHDHAKRHSNLTMVNWGLSKQVPKKPQKLHNVSGFGLGSIIWLPGHASVNIPLCIFQMFPDWQQLQGTYDLAEHAWMVRWTCHFCIPDFPQNFPCHFPQQLRRNIGGKSCGRYPTKTVRHGTIWPMSAPSWPGSAPGCRCQAIIVCHTSHLDFMKKHDMDLTFAHNRCCKVWHVSKGFGAIQAFDPSGPESYFVVSRMQQVNGSTSGAGFGVIKFLPDAAALDFCPRGMDGSIFQFLHLEEDLPD